MLCYVGQIAFPIQYVLRDANIMTSCAMNCYIGLVYSQASITLNVWLASLQIKVKINHTFHCFPSSGYRLRVGNLLATPIPSLPPPELCPWRARTPQINQCSPYGTATPPYQNMSNQVLSQGQAPPPQTSQKHISSGTGHPKSVRPSALWNNLPSPNPSGPMLNALFGTRGHSLAPVHLCLILR